MNIAAVVAWMWLAAQVTTITFPSNIPKAGQILRPCENSVEGVVHLCWQYPPKPVNYKTKRIWFTRRNAKDCYPNVFYTIRNDGKALCYVWPEKKRVLKESGQ